MHHFHASQLLMLMAIAFALNAPAQNGNVENHPALIQVEADRPSPIGLHTSPNGSNAALASEFELPHLPERPSSVLAATAFTPDGDGLNDKFFPYLMGMELVLSRFQVYDRWGRQLFTSTSGEGWDGTAGSGGAAMPLGVYVWRIEAWPAGMQDKVEQSGSVTLIR